MTTLQSPSTFGRRFTLFSHWLLACTATLFLFAPAQAAEKVSVTATFSILGDLTQVVGGDRISVTTLVGADADAHTFEPKPAHAKSLLRTRLLVTNGLGFEPWATRLARSAGYKGDIVVASKGVSVRAMTDQKGHSETDPHAWQNPNNVAVYVQNIADGLSKVDPGATAIYKANAAAYVKELQALDTWAKGQFATIPVPRRKAITSHDAFGYFAAHYGIVFLAPQGVNTDTEPSARQVAELIQQIRREKIRAVFVENMSNPKLIAQLARDAGAMVGSELYADALSGPHKPGASYLQMMRHNVAELVAGMRLN